MYYRAWDSEFDVVFVESESDAKPRFLKSSFAIRFLGNEKEPEDIRIGADAYRSMRQAK